MGPHAPKMMRVLHRWLVVIDELAVQNRHMETNSKLLELLLPATTKDDSFRFIKAYTREIIAAKAEKIEDATVVANLPEYRMRIIKHHAVKNKYI